MPRYFFDVHDGSFIRDDEGVELAGIADARKAVWDTLPAFATQRDADGNMAYQLRMDVRDESGKHVLHAALAFVMEPVHDLAS
jgi:hypothetical protein